MHQTTKQLDLLNYRIKEFFNQKKIKNKYPEIIAVSKTFSMNDILPLINYGHTHFGENKVQEGIIKWTDIKADFKNIKARMDILIKNKLLKNFFLVIVNR